jgi:hypothetical protein
MLTYARRDLTREPFFVAKVYVQDEETNIGTTFTTLLLCSRMLTYADVCWRMLTYAAHPLYALDAAHPQVDMLTYADVC